MLDISKVPTPCYVCEEELLERNLKILDRVQKESGAKILLALKGFAMWSTFDLVGKYLVGTSASGLHEAKLGRETMNKEVHTYSPAFKEEEIEEIARISDHLVFNSPGQVRRFLEKVYSRLGTTIANFDPKILNDLDGLHFHALCEQNVDALEGVLDAFEERFGDYIPKMKWINFGGGHHITREDYDVVRLIEVIRDFKKRHNDVTVYLEPGEAVGWQTGPLVASVLDIVKTLHLSTGRQYLPCR